MTVPSKMQLLQPKLHKLKLTYFKHFFVSLFVFLVLAIFAVIALQIWSYTSEKAIRYEKTQLRNIHNLPEVKLLESDPLAMPTNPQCSYWDCFNVYRCGHTGHDRITVYVYPLRKFVDENNVPATEVMSKEYFLILEAIINSKYYTANPKEACLFVPSIDTLNQDRLRINLTSKALQSLP